MPLTGFDSMRLVIIALTTRPLEWFSSKNYITCLNKLCTYREIYKVLLKFYLKGKLDFTKPQIFILQHQISNSTLLSKRLTVVLGIYVCMSNCIFSDQNLLLSKFPKIKYVIMLENPKQYSVMYDIVK